MANAVAEAKGVSVSTDLVDDIFDMAGAGAEFSSDEMQMPFIRIAQAMSPEIKKSDAKFIEGCGQGDIFNNLTQEYWGDGVELILEEDDVHFIDKDTADWLVESGVAEIENL